MSCTTVSEKDIKYIVDKLNDVIRKIHSMECAIDCLKTKTSCLCNTVDYLIDKSKGLANVVRATQSRWIITDSKPFTVNGGVNIINTWTPRTINNLEFKTNLTDPEKTLVMENITLNNNTIKFKEGIYIIKITSVFTNTGGTRLRLYNNSDNEVLTSSVSQYIAVSNTNIISTPISIEYRLSFSGVAKILEIQYHTTNTVLDIGLGVASGINNENEVYTIIDIEQIG